MLAKGTGVDLLCYVSIVEIDTKAIPYLIATLIPLNPDPALNEKCAVFWEYFRRTWLILYSPELWNIYRFRNDWEIIKFITDSTKVAPLFPFFQYKIKSLTIKLIS